MKIVRLHVYMAIASPMTLTFTQSQVRLKHDYFLTCNISDDIYANAFKLGMAVDLYTRGTYLHARLDDLDFDARS